METKEVYWIRRKLWLGDILSWLELRTSDEFAFSLTIFNLVSGNLNICLLVALVHGKVENPWKC